MIELRKADSIVKHVFCHSFSSKNITCQKKFKWQNLLNFITLEKDDYSSRLAKF